MDIDVHYKCELREIGDHETQDKRERDQYKSYNEKSYPTEWVDRFTLQNQTSDLRECIDYMFLQLSELYKETSSSFYNLSYEPCDKDYFSGFYKSDRIKKSFAESDQLNSKHLRRKIQPFSESKLFNEKLSNVSTSKEKVLKRKSRKKVKVKSLADLSLKAICLSCSKMCLMSTNDLHCLLTCCPAVHVSLTLNFLEPLEKQKYCYTNPINFFKTFHCDLNIDVLLSKLLCVDSMSYISLSYKFVTKSLNINVQFSSVKISNEAEPEIECLEKEQLNTCDFCCIKENALFTNADLCTSSASHSDFNVQHKTCCATCCVQGTGVNKQICDSEDSSEATQKSSKESGTKLKDKGLLIEKTEKVKKNCFVNYTELEKGLTEKFTFSKEEKKSQFNDADDERSILMELVSSDSIYLHHMGHSPLTSLEIYMMRSPARHTHPDEVIGIPWANFERETLRMASFFSYPQTAAQSAALLADSGFIYIGDGKSDKVICFFCYMVKENWKREDDIFLVHKSNSPQCPIVSVLQMNNVASITENNRAPEINRTSENSWTQSTSTVDQSSQFPNFSAVVAPSNTQDSTNTNIPNFGSTVPQITLSQATLMQNIQTPSELNNQTRQQSLAPSTVERSRPGESAFPNRILQLNRNIRTLRSNSNSGNDQHVIHPNINSQIYSIPRMPLSIQPVFASNESDVPVRELNLQDLGIFHERPKKPEFAILAKREESFEGWPPDCPVSKEMVAKSGVYYEGYGDSGRCFFCGGGLRKWETGDDPFVEHARWYPRCGYIRQYMGQGFVEVVQEIKSKKNHALQITREMVLQEMRKRSLTIANEFDEAPVENDPAVRSVLDEFRETKIYSREDIIITAKALRHDGVTLTSDELYAKLSQIRSKRPPEEASPVSGATAAVGNPVTEDAIEALKEENSTLRNNLICKICMDKEVKIVFLPCGHLVSCQECSVAFVDCPICRSHIRAYVRATIR